jgi:uncharacterized delta-60 repeat protein
MRRDLGMKVAGFSSVGRVRAATCLAAVLGTLTMFTVEVRPAWAAGGAYQWSSVTPVRQDLAGGGVVVDPAGGVLVEGQTESGNADITVTHFLANGSLDTSFGAKGAGCQKGSNGTVDVSCASRGLTYSGAAIAVQTDGKILAAGGIRWPINALTSSHPYAIAVARLNPDGTLDTRFGNHGVAGVNPCGPTTLTGQGSAASVTEAANGDIVMVGTASCIADSGDRMAVARLTPSGQPDTTFGRGAGYVVYNGAAVGAGYDGVMDSSGNIVAVGQEDVCGGANCWFLERLKPDGSLDTAFGPHANGTITMSPGGSQMSTAFNVALAGSKIIVSGACNLTSSTQKSGWYICAAKVTSNGALDPMFGSGGTMLMWDANRGSQTMAVQSNGDLVFGSPDLTVEPNTRSPLL